MITDVGLNVLCLPPDSWKSNLHCDGIWRWGLGEMIQSRGWSPLSMGLMPLQKRSLESCSLFFHVRPQ